MADTLPFDLEETDQVNAAYLEWRGEGDVDCRKVVELWTYCWVRRYYLQKLASEHHHDPAAGDALISKTFNKIQKSLQDGTYVDRYAHWVSVICKNTYLNYLNRKSKHFSADSLKGGPSTLANKEPAEVGFVRQEVSAAIDRLPTYLQAPVRGRLLEGLSYEKISEDIGKEVETVRSYVSKGLKRLRKDAHVLSCRGYDEENA